MPYVARQSPHLRAVQSRSVRAFVGGGAWQTEQWEQYVVRSRQCGQRRREKIGCPRFVCADPAAVTQASEVVVAPIHAALSGQWAGQIADSTGIVALGDVVVIVSLAPHEGVRKWSGKAERKDCGKGGRRHRHHGWHEMCAHKDTNGNDSDNLKAYNDFAPSVIFAKKRTFLVNIAQRCVVMLLCDVPQNYRTGK